MWRYAGSWLRFAGGEMTVCNHRKIFLYGSNHAHKVHLFGDLLIRRSAADALEGIFGHTLYAARKWAFS